MLIQPSQTERHIQNLVSHTTRTDNTNHAPLTRLLVGIQKVPEHLGQGLGRVLGVEDDLAVRGLHGGLGLARNEQRQALEEEGD